MSKTELDTKVIAVDFDGTLCAKAYPDIGAPNLPLIADLIKRQELGDRLILWTCRKGRRLWEAVGWCMAHGLYFDAVNENLPEHIAVYGGDTRKVYADLYIDDKAVPVSEQFPLTRAKG